MNQNSKKNIARNVEKLRRERKITKEALSLALGFDNSYISKLEKENINITIEKLDKIADYLNVSTKELFN